MTKDFEEITVDGVRMVFQNTPGTEAPAEMNTYFPQFKALWMAENSTNTLHNVLTLRGAQVRDPLKWAGFLDETIDKYGKGTEVKFPSHHWPMWGNAKIIDYWKKQRDIYKYIHDQAVNLMNKGYTGIEIANMVKLPPELDKAWHIRGYYGTVRHNTRAVYQRYMGWYDANPSTLDQLPPDATHLVVSIGGNDALGQSVILGAASHSVADSLMKLADIQAAFRSAYVQTVEAVLQRNLPAAFCTIYDPRYPDPIQRRVATTALAVINDCIVREAVTRNLPLIDLRVVCNEDSDLTNPIEPSVQGGGKIAKAITALLLEHDFSARRSVVFAR
jgi:lysophospholipase L1-like esterase